LLGAVRNHVPVYGSGGFTSYSRAQLQKQLGDWAASGISRVKMKVGTHPSDEPERVRQAREAIGEATELFVDANGAYSRKQALALAEAFAALGVTWFEEPVPFAALCEAHALPFSAHCAPSLYAHTCCALPPTRHLECFHDHDRIEHVLFDGVPTPRDGALWPD